MRHAKVSCLLSDLGGRPGEPSWQTEEGRPAELSQEDAHFLAKVAEDMAVYCADMMTS
jgi:hypothetical protein